MTEPTFILYNGRTVSAALFRDAQADGATVFIQYNATRQEVHQGDYDRLIEFVDSLVQVGIPARQSLLLCFDGWDSDLRELSEIPEVREYIRHTAELYPFIFYYLHAQLNPHVFIALVAHTLLSSPLFPRIAGVLDAKCVELNIPFASVQINETQREVIKYGRDLGDAEGARLIMRRWRAVLNLW